MPKRSRDEEELDVGDAPTEINPYTVLGLEVVATQDEVKRAYRKAALRHHPDKASADDKDAAHTRFQEIAFAFAILSDERRRKRYDTTGRTEECIDLDDDFDWTSYYHDQFAGVVTEATINKFADEYKGSDEERQHVLEAYNKVKGSMPSLYSLVMLSDMLEDESRFRIIIDQAIANNEVDAYSKYTNESEKSRQKRLEQAKKRRDKESKEAEMAAKEIEEANTKKKAKKAKGAGDIGDLAALIQQRQQGRSESFFDKLEAKYAPKGQQGSMDEPPEEAFAANRKTTKSKK